MKKILCMIMAIIMVMSLVACGNKTVDPTEPDNTPVVNPTDNGENTGDATTDTPDNGDDSTPVTQPSEEVEGFTYAEELAVALISQTGGVAPVATSRVDLVDVTTVKEATGIEDVAKIKNVAVTESVDPQKVFKIVIVIFTDETAATNNAEAMKNALSTLGDSCVSVATKNYAIAVVMNAADSDTVSAQGICDKFTAMIADEANIYFPTRHLDEETPVETPEDTEATNPEVEEPVVDDTNNETEAENTTEATENTEG
ncbi:MAG: hypothetical protein IJ419_03550 [Agathobacter sp.]|nr:hypothetical protein [Agathobacter sp.]